ncbi:MAG: hypothetical protein HKP61_17115 [Dactylosporangium sp.]|nr:hypothetical protein [Dactylosporangium sp.]NNJ62627.1 hypothetical protein [Dactylosporangium sp.]
MSTSVEAYFDQDHGEHPIVVRRDEDMDALIDALLAQPFSNSMATLYVAERPLNAAGVPDHEFAIGVDAEDGVGSLWYMGAGGGWYSQGARSQRDEVYYCYMGNDRDFPADSVIPLELVRQAAKEFLANAGARPVAVAWQLCTPGNAAPAA